MAFLTIARKRGENILIHCPDGKTIQIAMIDLYHNRARVGIDAPQEYRVERGIVEGVYNQRTKKTPESQLKRYINNQLDLFENT